MPRFHERATVPSAALLTACVVMAVGFATAGERAGLTRLRQVCLSVEVAHPLRTMTADDLTAHLMSALQGAELPLTIQNDVSDRIRLIVSVRPMSATMLRGFWLPFSGTYGIGVVRLGVERTVSLPGVPPPFPAVVWQTERTVGSPWQATDG